MTPQSPRLPASRPACTHHLTLRALEWADLCAGVKHFLVFEEPAGGIQAGDRLVMTCAASPDATLVRVVRYAERGRGYAPNYVGVELAPEARV
jgi:hypothetical protein